MAKIITNIEDIKDVELALTIGFFDGVHCGHRFLLQHLNSIAKEEGLQSAFLTFWPHPRIVLHKQYQPQLLNSTEERAQLFSALPTQYCIQVPFTTEFSEFSAYEFMKEVLFDKLHVRHLIIGHDHRFGHNRSEGYDDYCLYGESMGMKVSQAPIFTDNGNTISSSFIRKQLANGNIKIANQLLGYNYTLTGTIVHGKQIGRTIGFPTANLDVTDNLKCIPANGVYAVKVNWKEHQLNGMACIGTRPTFENQGMTSIEIHLFDFNQNIYGEKLDVKFIEFIRPQKKFASTSELIEALQNDRKSALESLSRS